MLSSDSRADLLLSLVVERSLRTPLLIRLRAYIFCNKMSAVTYDHRLRKSGHPVRSAVLKPQIGGLVVGWVTTSEYPLLYVLFSLLL